MGQGQSQQKPIVLSREPTPEPLDPEEARKFREDKEAQRADVSTTSYVGWFHFRMFEVAASCSWINQLNDRQRAMGHDFFIIHFSFSP